MTSLGIQLSGGQTRIFKLAHMSLLCGEKYIVDHNYLSRSELVVCLFLFSLIFPYDDEKSISVHRQKRALLKNEQIKYMRRLCYFAILTRVPLL